MAEVLRAPTREYRTVIVDSRRWADFAAREDDIVIATFAKCGTTWMQRIVDLLVFQDPAPRPILETSVWLDSRFFAPLADDLARLEAQPHRRFIKSHLPFDALPVYSGVKYIHVARDGRDAFMSWHNHASGFTPEANARIGAAAAQDPVLAKGAPPEVPEDPAVMFKGWLAQAGAEPSSEPGTELSFFDFETTFWNERDNPNLLFVHYNDLKADLAGEMRRIAGFLDIEMAEDRLAELAAAARFEAMSADGERLLPGIEAFFDRGARRFLNKGVNGRWRDVLSPEDLAEYDALAARKLAPQLRAWLEAGRAAGDPGAAAV